MRIKSFAFADPHGAGWTLGPLELKPTMNLFVGASGSGKTRALNMLFNIALCATHDTFLDGEWTLEFQHSGLAYTWTYAGLKSDEREDRVVQSEQLWIGTSDRVERSLFRRSQAEFTYDGKDSPKLSRQNSGIYLLREEDTIKPVHEAFSRIMRRRFWSEDLSQSLSMQSISRQTIRKLDQRADMNEVFKLQAPLHLAMYLLRSYFEATYELISDHFKRVFPFVDHFDIRTADETLNAPIGAPIPVLFIKEKGIQKPIPLNEIASGMQKVLLIIVDVVTSPDDIIYMIDEYENSLGVNAIDFFPAFVAECGGARQFIVTTHHPLLINAIPVGDWFVFHRKGMDIIVTHGRELEERYGRSKQKRFTQLINDPLYTEGVE